MRLDRLLCERGQGRLGGIKDVLHALGDIPSPAARLPLLPAGTESVRAAARLVSCLSGALVGSARAD